MGADSRIEWTSHTFNPWTGCAKVSEGCRHCYAEAWAKRSGLVQWGPGAERRRTSAATWRQPMRWNAAAERTGERPRVFCASLADVFDPAAPDAWRADLWALIETTPALDWLLLTKRVQYAAAMVPPAWLAGGWPPHLWLGITVTGQAEADRDVPRLLDLPAPVRFLSCEPLLGPLDLCCIFPFCGLFSRMAISCLATYRQGRKVAGIDWVIAGGESGPHARPMHPDWARSLRDQCQAAAVPFLFKQWGEWAPLADWGDWYAEHERSLPLRRWSAEGWTDDYGDDDAEWMLRLGKRAAGRVLDGRTWDEIPPSPAAARTTTPDGAAGPHRQTRRAGTAGGAT